MSNSRTPQDLFPERITSKIEVDPITGCWNWTATLDRGYGIVGFGRKLFRMHRVAYERAIGPIPPKYQIDHLCWNRRCCNPDHLEAVTARENNMRSNSIASIAAKKTHCPKGHPYSGENLYTTPSGDRRCRECARVRRASDAARYRKSEFDANKYRTNEAYREKLLAYARWYRRNKKH
jgi:hypothetical protein